MKKALFRKISISLTILIIGIICFSFFKLISWYVNSSRKIDDTDTEAIVKYHILVAGSSENETFIRQVYSGAAQRATSYSAAVQLYIPQNSFGETTVQDIFDYASFLEPDGIIICFDDIPKNALTPCYKDGSNIPVITTGQYYSDWPQVSFIGVNYSELGNVFAQEIISSLKSDDDSVLLIDSSNTNDANYSVLMNTLMNTLTEKKVNVQSL
jgi:ABC-type sugar transport system substrate-binding protein